MADIYQILQSDNIVYDFQMHSVLLTQNGWEVAERDASGERIGDGNLTSYVVLGDSTVERDSCNYAGGTARFTFIFYDRPAPHWPGLRIRPRLRMRDGNLPEDWSEWFNLGIYFTETPSVTGGPDPKIWDVDCHDIIVALDVPSTTGFSFPAAL